jgi:hypothetical protein
MTAMFPDSGVPASDARNTIPDPVTNANCNELWYSTSRCQPRFDPAAANAVLAELVNITQNGEVVYDCSKLDQVQLAINYIIQRGKMSGDVLAGGPLNYVGNLNPPATRYNDWMMITVVPNVNNSGPAVTLSLDGVLPGPAIVHPNGSTLSANELVAGVPQVLVFFNGAWRTVGNFTSPADFIQPKALFNTGAIASIPYATQAIAPLSFISSEFLNPVPVVTGGNAFSLPVGMYMFVATAPNRIQVGPLTQCAWSIRVLKNGAPINYSYEFSQLLAGQDATTYGNISFYGAASLPGDYFQLSHVLGTTYAADMVQGNAYAGQIGVLRIGGA